MSERKAINKYYPPDFDPSKIKKPKKKKGKAAWPSVRLMAPFSMKCLKCNEYVAQSRKFNAKKEVTDKDYLGIKIIHFHIRCPRCFNSMVFATDPQNGDFECVSGCKRNFERAKKSEKKEENLEDMISRLEKEDKQEQLEKEKEKNRKLGRPINSNGEIETGLEQLERRTKQQQKEQEMDDKVEELRNRSRKLENARRQMQKRDIEKEQDEQDEQEARRAFKKARAGNGKSRTKKVRIHLDMTTIEKVQDGNAANKASNRALNVVPTEKIANAITSLNGYSSSDSDEE